MPDRTGEIARTSPLRTKTPLERTSRLRSSGPIKAKRPSQCPEERVAKGFTRGRSQGWCEMRVPGVCLGRAREFSHRWAEGQGGPWCASNGLASCGLAGCHGWLHRNPIEAKRLGCHQVTLTTTNDNIGALRFYQRRGFRLAAVRPGAVDRTRQRKPDIPRTGDFGIPLRDEIDLTCPV